MIQQGGSQYRQLLTEDTEIGLYKLWWLIPEHNAENIIPGVHILYALWVSATRQKHTHERKRCIWDLTKKQNITRNPSKQRGRKGTCVLHCWFVNALSVIALYHTLCSKGVIKCKAIQSKATATYCEGRAIWPKISIYPVVLWWRRYIKVFQKLKECSTQNMILWSFYLLCGNVIEQTLRQNEI